MLTDEQWAVLEPLMEAYRLKGEHRSRRAVSTIVWRHENCAK